MGRIFRLEIHRKESHTSRPLVPTCYLFRSRAAHSTCQWQLEIFLTSYLWLSGITLLLLDVKFKKKFFFLSRTKKLLKSCFYLATNNVFRDKLLKKKFFNNFLGKGNSPWLRPCCIVINNIFVFVEKFSFVTNFYQYVEAQSSLRANPHLNWF